MSNVIRTRRNQYLRPQGNQSQIPSASRPATPFEEEERTIEIEAQQQDAYAQYHDLCRRALAEYFHEDPDRNWNYVDRLRRIWEAGNSMESILSPQMHIKLTSDPLTRSAIGRLYRHYDSFHARISDNFETPQRNVNRNIVSFGIGTRNPRIGEPSSSRMPIQSTQSTPRNTSIRQDPRLSVASTSNITMDRGAPRPSSQ